MASRLRTRTQDLLGHDKLGEVDELLRKFNYDDTTFFELGLQLGLQYATLNKIKAEHSISNCLIECLNAWIEQVDDVKKYGGPSYYTLIVALRIIKQNRVADAIDEEKHPACAILACYKDEKFILNPLPQLAVLLYKEDLIRARILPNADGALSLLREVQQSICANHRNLMKFADVLKLMPATQKIAREIKESYLEKVHSNEIVDEAEVTEITDISIQGQELDAFNAIRTKFASTVYDATEAMVSISERDLRTYLCRGYPHLASKLEKCTTIDDLLNMLANECSLTDVSLLEAVADRFKISPATELIQEYKEAVDDFCEKTPLTECLNKKISSGSMLESEKIVIHVRGLASEHRFKDVKELTEHAFGKLNSQVKITVIVVKKSFTVTCSFPLILSESLIASVLQNLETLKAKGLEQLTIGYGIVYDVDEKECDEAAVYARKGIVEQLLLSRTVQLINCCQEKKAIIAEAEKKKVEYQEEKEMLSKNLISCQQSDSEVSISADIATIVYAAMTRHKHIINIEFVSDITHMFRKYQFYGHQYPKFGIYLNIPKERLDFIERNFKGDLARCLIECLMAWLRSPDDPSTKSWETLILAIRHVDEKEVADNIYNEKCKPCEVLPEYYVKLFGSIEEPFELADILCSKGVLDETSLTKIKKATKEEKTALLKARELLLQVIQKSICRRKENLKIFAEALQKFSSTAQLGDEILEKCSFINFVHSSI
ncbi:PREDICTED: uncharacterized protein LOC109586293 isoform X2 [Amphimedon queenslandica]|uniref:Death domain-containing protein n=1 Tax=Amphimedon queenslandica TaxID=400682 RepID=A0AAN0JLZ7_AMPQE|nr:PREDICTED: uncharacterized protein LOC109586293 isoform X2 [Amphimedon queenslandica]|eukprot:XP_019858031.1 PREDICTED: uncharacterized protein LOC109586293 isoform X2 [Amphimedon queenslandica]